MSVVTRGAAQWSMAQSGIALLTVLMVLAVAALLASEMVFSGISESQHTAVRRDVRQAWYYALGGEAYARELLWQDHRDDQGGSGSVDGVHDLWRDGRGRFALDGGELQVQVTDLQGRFNLANLRSTEGGEGRAMQQLIRLLDTLGQEPQLALRIADWVDSDTEPRPGGAEDAHYTRQAAPALTANAVPVDLAELHGLARLTPGQYASLASHLTTLPEPTRLNVNTAPASVLQSTRTMSTKPGEPPVRAQQVLGDALQARAMAGAIDQAGQFTTSSSWFEIDVVAVYRQRTARLLSVVHRDSGSGLTRVVYRSTAGRIRAEGG